MMDRRKVAETIKDATDKAGLLVTVALLVACLGLVVAGVALVVSLKGRAA